MDVVGAFAVWYDSLTLYGGFPAKGTIGGALTVLQHLRGDFNLSLEAHTATGGSQVRGASGQAVQQILASFGETRPFVKEGGRTNRGLRGDVRSLLDALGSCGMDELPADERDAEIVTCQQFLVAKVCEFHNRQRIKVGFDPSVTLIQFFRDILDQARETGREGPVAQYMVGAKLALRFPGVPIGNESYSTADDQLGRAGDFLINDLAIHVTVAPMPPVYLKCESNHKAGMRPLLLVPERVAVGAKQTANGLAPAHVEVFAIEDYLAANIWELSTGSIQNRSEYLGDLLRIYNQRVDACETDKSMMVEIPHNLT